MAEATSRRRASMRSVTVELLDRPVAMEDTAEMPVAPTSIGLEPWDRGALIDELAAFDELDEAAPHRR